MAIHIHVGKKRTTDAGFDGPTANQLQTAKNLAQKIITQLGNVKLNEMSQADFENEIIKRLRGVTNWL